MVGGISSEKGKNLLNKLVFIVMSYFLIPPADIVLLWGNHKEKKNKTKIV